MTNNEFLLALLDADVNYETFQYAIQLAMVATAAKKVIEEGPVAVKELEKVLTRLVVAPI